MHSFMIFVDIKIMAGTGLGGHFGDRLILFTVDSETPISLETCFDDTPFLLSLRIKLLRKVLGRLSAADVDGRPVTA